MNKIMVKIVDHSSNEIITTTTLDLGVIDLILRTKLVLVGNSHYDLFVFVPSVDDYSLLLVTAR